MKILVDGRTFSLQRKGGVSKVWTELLRQFDAMGHDITLALYPNGESNVHLSAAVKSFSPRFSTISLSVPPSDSSNHAGEEAEKLREKEVLAAGKSYDLLVNTYYGEPLLKDLPYAVVFHDFAHEDLDLFRLRPTTAHVLHLKRLAAAHATGLIFITRYSRERYHELYGRPAAVDRVIYHGNEPVKGPLPKKKRQMLHVGSRGLYKNFPVLYPLFKDAMKADYNVVIAGGEAADAELNAFRDEYAAMFQIVPQPSDVEMHKLMLELAYFVSASKYEGFGLPLLQALASGTWPIVSKIEPYVEIAGTNATYMRNDDLSAARVVVNSKYPPVAVRRERLWDLVATEYLDFFKYMLRANV
ncbi:glycosyltransferase [Sphingomonas sp. MMS24-J13]|uniref:glycosyltransferase n=1 Tax=Sphingomonas sp. MMS24-J13 TaxID=3238686 RepID=UPI0038516E65